MTLILNDEDARTLRDVFSDHLRDLRLEDMRAFAATRPDFQRPMYRVPRRPGVAGVAANFVAHISDLMDGRVGR